MQIKTNLKDRHQLVAHVIALFEAGQKTEAEREAKRLVEAWPEDGECWRNYAIIATSNQSRDCRHILSRAVAFYPNDVAVLLRFGQILVADGDFFEAEKFLKRALVLQPQTSECLFEYAAVLYRLGNIEDALKYFLDLIALNPHILDAHLGAGACAQKLHKPDVAVSIYQLALRYFPQCADLHFQCANLFLQQAAFGEAVVCYQAAIACGQKSGDCYLNLGIALKNSGRFSESLGSLRLALEYLLQQLKSADDHVQLVRPMAMQKALPAPWAKKVLQSLKRRCAAYGLDWCLMAGTLLGIYRDGDFIRGDKDMDIGMRFDVDRARLEECLCGDGEFVKQTHFGKVVDQVSNYSFTVKHRQSDISVDIFFLQPFQDDYFLMGVDHPGQAILSRLTRFEFAQFCWQDEMWPVPSDVEAYFLEVYGVSWREPNPFYDTIISHPCRIAASIPVVLCYGYAQLYAYLSNQKWAHAFAYSEQLLGRQQDELLEDVRNFSEEKLPRWSDKKSS